MADETAQPTKTAKVDVSLPDQLDALLEPAANFLRAQGQRDLAYQVMGVGVQYERKLQEAAIMAREAARLAQ